MMTFPRKMGKFSTTNQINKYPNVLCKKGAWSATATIHSKEMNLKKRRISHSLEYNRTVGKTCLQYIHSFCCQIARNLEPTFRRNPVQHIALGRMAHARSLQNTGPVRKIIGWWFQLCFNPLSSKMSPSKSFSQE